MLMLPQKYVQFWAPNEQKSLPPNLERVGSTSSSSYLALLSYPSLNVRFHASWTGQRNLFWKHIDQINLFKCCNNGIKIEILQFFIVNRYIAQFFLFLLWKNLHRNFSHTILVVNSRLSHTKIRYRRSNNFGCYIWLWVTFVNSRSRQWILSELFDLDWT